MKSNFNVSRGDSERRPDVVCNLVSSTGCYGGWCHFPCATVRWRAADYNKATSVKINYQSVGSGAGIRQIEAKTVDFGASDMPLKDDELAKKV